jgi:hypothetical protein
MFDTTEAAATPASTPDTAVLTDGELEDELCSHAAHLTVAECRMVLLVAELDRRGTWAAGGLRSTAHWLNWRCGVSLGAAREQVRVGRALVDLPVLRAAFATGELSYSKVRAITRVANRRLEASLVDMARYATASQLERIVREYRRAAPDEGPAALARHARRYLRSYTDDDGMVVIRARLSPEDGAVVLAAIEAARRALVEDRTAGGAVAVRGGAGDVSAETSPDEDPTAGAADGLVTVCEGALSRGPEPAADVGPGVAAVVHVDEQVLEDPSAEGCAYVEDVGAISSHTARRLLCGAAVSTVRFRPDGGTEPEGRTRRIPLSLRRAVGARDGGCRWPGCTQRRFVDVHHVEFVSRGGRTVLSNLTTLCRRHHRLVHEGGFVVEMSPAGRVRVTSPDGVPVPQVPAPPAPRGPGLEDRHRAEGLDVGPETLRYCGERFDLGLTVDVLLCQSG